MKRYAFRLRSLTAVLLVVFGLIIVERGVAQAAPLTFTLMGVVMIALGLYRLRILRARISGHD